MYNVTKHHFLKSLFLSSSIREKDSKNLPKSQVISLNIGYCKLLKFPVIIYLFLSQKYMYMIPEAM